MPTMAKTPASGHVAGQGDGVRRRHSESHTHGRGDEHRRGRLEEDDLAEFQEAEAGRAQQGEGPPPFDDAGEHADGEAACRHDQDEVPDQALELLEAVKEQRVSVDPVLLGVDDGVRHEGGGLGADAVLGGRRAVGGDVHRGDR
jgi:hypothetical protein